MTRPELHELVDIVMDARERTKKALKLEIFSDVHFWDHSKEDMGWIRSGSFRTFSDFTQAVKEYIKTLEK